MPYRLIDLERDTKAAHRIWQEIGWENEQRAGMVELFAQCGRVMVADLNGEAECLVTSAPGAVRYLDEDVAATFITAVSTSRVARKQGFARRLTAHLIAANAAEGAPLAALGMFEQGFYDQLGFGSGGYEHFIRFDPSQLQTRARARVPRRLTMADWEAMHTARLARWRWHGGVNLHAPLMTKAETMELPNSFGLGYTDQPDGSLSHYVWMSASEHEHGPYTAKWLVYRTAEQLHELLALIQSLGDQVWVVSMREPPGVQMQDLLTWPIKQQQSTRRSEFERGIRSLAFWQMRLCDLPACLAQTRLPGHDTVRFNLSLSDPIARWLEAGVPWRGVGGDYTVTLGPESHAGPGRDATLPTLTASVGAFTRLWLGVRPASGLAITDDLSGPPDLLRTLDGVLRLPPPRPDWEF